MVLSENMNGESFVWGEKVDNKRVEPSGRKFLPTLLSTLDDIFLSPLIENLDVVRSLLHVRSLVNKRNQGETKHRYTICF